MNNPVVYNPAQLAFIQLFARYSYLVAGRGFGKSTLFGDKMHQIIRYLPGSSSIIAAKSYTHVLTSILPSAFTHLERLGYLQDIHYVVGNRPPKEWGLPFNAPVKNYENYITFFNKKRAVGFSLISQEREGAGRGPNADYLLTDETLRLNNEKLNKEIRPTLRANKERFKHLSWHLGEFHCTSMPYTLDSKWILDKAAYYLNDFGIDYFGTWKQIVKKQIELLDITDKEEFTYQYNAIQRLRRLISPRLDKSNTTLFMFANAFDNWQNLGLSYLIAQRQNLPDLLFRLEIMNDIMELLNDAYYNLIRDKHVFYDSYDDSFTENYANTVNFNWKMLEQRDCRFDSKKYYSPEQPFYLFFDWGGRISFLLTAQQFKIHNQNEIRIQNEFFVKPPGEMTARLINQFCDYYQYHTNKDIYFVSDTFGDNAGSSINSSRTINEQAIQILKMRGWNVSVQKHPYKEPPAHEKWQLMNNVLNETDTRFPRLRINGNNCKNLIVSMEQTTVKESNNKFEKNKSMERKPVDQEHAPHSTDALDKGFWWFVNSKKITSFLDIRI